jgi:hypothetical protein
MKFFEDLAGTQVVFKENLEPLGAVTIKLIDQLDRVKYLR